MGFTRRPYYFVACSSPEIKASRVLTLTRGRAVQCAGARQLERAPSRRLGARSAARPFFHRQRPQHASTSTHHSKAHVGGGAPWTRALTNITASCLIRLRNFELPMTTKAFNCKARSPPFCMARCVVQWYYSCDPSRACSTAPASQVPTIFFVFNNQKYPELVGLRPQLCPLPHRHRPHHLTGQLQ